LTRRSRSDRGPGHHSASASTDGQPNRDIRRCVWTGLEELADLTGRVVAWRSALVPTCGFAPRTASRSVAHQKRSMSLRTTEPGFRQKGSRRAHHEWYMTADGDPDPSPERRIRHRNVSAAERDGPRDAGPACDTPSAPRRIVLGPDRSPNVRLSASILRCVMARPRFASPREMFIRTRPSRTGGRELGTRRPIRPRSWPASPGYLHDKTTPSTPHLPAIPARSATMHLRARLLARATE